MSNPKKILLVDDDPDIRAMICAFLAPKEYEITQAEDVSAALHELSRGQTFDLAILDFWLGKDHAVSIIDSIRSKASDIPVMVISGGNGSMDLEITAAISDASGALAFLQKPFRKADLIGAVAKLMV